MFIMNGVPMRIARSAIEHLGFDEVFGPENFVKLSSIVFPFVTSLL